VGGSAGSARFANQGSAKIEGVAPAADIEIKVPAGQLRLRGRRNSRQTACFKKSRWNRICFRLKQIEALGVPK
jgi:hypothetical protein